MSDRLDAIPAWVPKAFRDIADVVGLKAALTLAKEQPGQRIYVPTRPAKEHWISKTIGADLAAKLAYDAACERDGVEPRPYEELSDVWRPEDLPGRRGFDVAHQARGSKVEARVGELEVLARPAHKVAPGRYRAWLGPAALHEWMQMLAWGGFGLKAQRTKQSPLLRMLEGDARFGTDVHLEEHVEGALAPAFQGDGFARPARVPLVTAGAPAGALVSPRSSREFGVPHTGASDAERPEALAMAGGSLAPDDVLGSLGTGLYVGNLWYLNFSDRMACRATGMTRFATFWVEGGEIVAPVDTMRFDETAYHMLGDNLVAIGSDVETLADGSTYGARSTDVWRLPGVLVEDYALTL